MPLDPRFQALLEQATAQAQSAPREPMALLKALRENQAAELRASASARASIALAEPVTQVEDRVLPGPEGDIPVRLYTPEGIGPFPTLVFFHGGGWIFGNLDTHDLMCRRLCRGAGCLVLSVDNRLAPEHKFPAGLQDCYAATCWMASHVSQFNGDPARIAVGGDSAGGNFTAAVTQMVRDQGGPTLAFQLLLWPVTDFRLTTSSWQEYEGYLMSSQDFLIVKDLYLNHEEEQSHPYAAPLLATDLRGLPPALVITAECDPVRDGGEQYGQRLLEAGVPATVSRYDGMVHGFMHMGSIVPQQAKQAFDEASHALRTAFASTRNKNKSKTGIAARFKRW